MTKTTKTAKLNIAYDWADSDPLTRLVCRGLEAHDFPEEGKEGQERPGTYICRRCQVVKRVREALR